MGKRPYYVISHIVECEGYSSYIDYVGTNLKAAINRFKFICEDIKKQYFLDENIAEDNINANFMPANDWDQYLSVIGNRVRYDINDDNECWIGVWRDCCDTNRFLGVMGGYDYRHPRLNTDNNTREDRYKHLYPNSKY